MKLVWRALKWLLIVVVGLLILLVASVGVDMLVGGGRLDGLTNTRIATASGPQVRAFVARPATPGPHPAVIMIHEFWGLKDDIVGKAEALAKEGYVVVAPDLFRGNTTSWIPRAIFQVMTNPQPQLLGDLDAVFAWLSTQPDVKPDRIAVMGFCFGGGASLRYSLSNNKLAATAIFYGALVTDPAQLKTLPGPVLGIFGGADQAPSVAQVRAFETALKQTNVPHQITVYDGQPHAFVRSIEEIRQGGPQGQAWSELLGFLKQNLQTGRSSHHDGAPSTAASGTDWGYLLRLAYEHTIGRASHRH